MFVTKGKIDLVRITFKGKGISDTFFVDSATANKMERELAEEAGTTGDVTANTATPTRKKRGRPGKVKAVATEGEETEAVATWPGSR